MTTTPGARQAGREGDVERYKPWDEVESAGALVRAVKIFKKGRNTYEAQE